AVGVAGERSSLRIGFLFAQLISLACSGYRKRGVLHLAGAAIGRGGIPHSTIVVSTRHSHPTDVRAP
ncbi:hypothetical protein, partial [Xanthomonas hortorum]|uniref:hypothetical protein n=1 Tax=Xanthomonas hortorum TaxID=56454 RepID=UPI001F4621BA